MQWCGVPELLTHLHTKTPVLETDQVALLVRKPCSLDCEPQTTIVARRETPCQRGSAVARTRLFPVDFKSGKHRHVPGLCNGHDSSIEDLALLLSPLIHSSLDIAHGVHGLLGQWQKGTRPVFLAARVFQLVSPEHCWRACAALAILSPCGNTRCLPHDSVAVVEHDRERASETVVELKATPDVLRFCPLRLRCPAL